MRHLEESSTSLYKLISIHHDNRSFECRKILLRPVHFEDFYVADLHISKSTKNFLPFWDISALFPLPTSWQLTRKIWIRAQKSYLTLSAKFLIEVHFVSLKPMVIMRQKEKVGQKLSLNCQVSSPSSTTTTTDGNEWDPNWGAGDHSMLLLEHTEIGDTQRRSLVGVEIELS